MEHNYTANEINKMPAMTRRFYLCSDEKQKYYKGRPIRIGVAEQTDAYVQFQDAPYEETYAYWGDITL